MRILSIITAALVLAGSLAAQSVQDMHRAVVARKNVATPPSGGIMFISVTTTPVASTRSPTISYPTAVANDIWLLFISSDTVVDFNGTPPAGWTKIGADVDASFNTTAVFWRRATGSEGASEAWTNIISASNNAIAAIVVYRGCELTGDPQDATMVPETSGFGTAKDISITTATNGAMVVAAFGVDSDGSALTFAWDAGIDERLDSGTTPSGRASTGEQLHIGDRVVSVAGVAAMGGDLSSGTSGAEIAIALKAE
jgi:hypothetical protein